MVEADGGAGTFTYAWSNGDTGNGIEGVSAGIYSVIITDGDGCNTTKEINLKSRIQKRFTELKLQNQYDSDGFAKVPP